MLLQLSWILQLGRKQYGLIFLLLIGLFFANFYLINRMVSISSTESISTDVTSTGISYCSRDQVRNGQWEAVNHSMAPYVPAVSWEKTCYGKGGSRQGELEQTPFADTQWTVSSPEKCSFVPFSVERFCQVVGNRTIAFLGDSITWQQYNSLSYLTHAKDEFREIPKCLSHACNGTVKLFWQRDNYATEKGMKSVIKSVDPDIIVFNRGAHYTENITIISQLNKTLVSAGEWQKDCKEKGRDCILFWRTTAPGFPQCNSIPGPLTNRTFGEARVQNKSLYPSSHNWWEFASQNSIVEELLKTHKLRLSFIDFYEMAMLRPDNHIDAKDCLHWCLPGPMDAANAVLLHKLEAILAWENSSDATLQF